MSEYLEKMCMREGYKNFDSRQLMVLHKHIKPKLCELRSIIKTGINYRRGHFEIKAILLKTKDNIWIKDLSTIKHEFPYVKTYLVHKSIRSIDTKKVKDICAICNKFECIKCKYCDLKICDSCHNIGCGKCKYCDSNIECDLHNLICDCCGTDICESCVERCSRMSELLDRDFCETCMESCSMIDEPYCIVTKKLPAFIHDSESEN